MALHVGLRAPRALAGILVLSGYLVVPQHLEEERAAANQQTPLLFCHGRYDQVVRYPGGKASYERVKQAGYPAEWAEFDMEHSLCIEEVGVIKDWLLARLPKQRASPPRAPA